MATIRPGRRTCTAEPTCRGAQVSPNGPCLAHLDETKLAATLAGLHKGDRLDASRVRFTKALVERLLAALPKDEADRPTLECRAHFIGANFEGEANFSKVNFVRGAHFGSAVFEGSAAFEEAIFGGSAWFGNATFKAEAYFSEAVLNDTSWFEAAHFGGKADFDWSIFTDRARFNKAVFLSRAQFRRATFEDEALFERVLFNEVADFGLSTFAKAQQLGPMLVCKDLVLDQVVFRRRIHLDVAAARLLCRRARFLDGGQLRLRWAQITLDDTDLAAPVILSGTPAFVGLDESNLIPGWQELRGTRQADGQPWLVSLRRADVGGLVISEVDLQACCFAGAHNLDRLRLESLKAFGGTPGWQAIEAGWAWPPAWRWTRRQTLAEEHLWRAEYERGIRRAGWHGSATRPATVSQRHPNSRERGLGRRWHKLGYALSDWRRTTIRLARLRGIGAARARLRRHDFHKRQERAREVSNLYRALRKGREDNKDEPGAADFYYGEMELRRKATPRSAERLILLLYWLVAGYGLRAWRAVVALMVAIVTFSLMMIAVGYETSGSEPIGTTPTTVTPPSTLTTQLPNTSFTDTMIYGARTALGLPREPQPILTRWGDLFLIGLRIIVPVLLGLAALSIRGRVKR